MSSSPLAVVVLAAGAGTRMLSRTPKVLHELAGIPLIGHVLGTAQALNPAALIAVVRHESDAVTDVIGDFASDAIVVHQDEIPGTGRAVELALASIPQSVQKVVVLSADVPLLDSATLQTTISLHESEKAAVTVLTTVVDDATGYGRVVREPDGTVKAIVEHKDATEAERLITEVNSGVYVFDVESLRKYLPALTTQNTQSEKYLTDVVGLAVADGLIVHAVLVEDSWLVEGVNDRIQLSSLARRLNDMIIRGWQRDGVSIVDPQSVWIDLGVVLSPDVTVLPGVQLHGNTVVGEGATIGPDCTLRDTEVGADATVVRSVATEARIESGASVGPFSFLRPGTTVGQDGKVGAFVETKNSSIGAGAKVPHLSYIGDAEIGEGANIGAGTITANYDGVNKHRTVVGPHARTGSDNVFVAPVTIGAGAYTAAGITIRHDVPPGSLAVMPGTTRTVEGWVGDHRPGTASADAAAKATTPPPPTRG